MRSSFKGGSAVASLSHRRANTALPGDGLYMGINIPEVERQKASKLWSNSGQTRVRSDCPLSANSGQAGAEHPAQDGL